jgi:Ni,Fe-hydrogenase III large subunit
MTAAVMIQSGKAIDCRPWTRYVLAPEAWSALVPDDVTLRAFWADTAECHALFTGPDGLPLLVSVAVRDGVYPALSPAFPAAAAPERLVQDLWGHTAQGIVDQRPWLDHGRWLLSHPMAPRHGPPSGPMEPEFRPVADPALVQLPIGPAAGTLAEPAHLRVHTNGEVAVAMEARLGYAHKGALLLMRGKSPRAAARFAARLSADSTVAHALAFARAAEAALAMTVSPRTLLLRGVMAELERIATHLGDVAAARADAPWLAGRLGWHREQILRACAVAFGHRMMMDYVIPGGLAADITESGTASVMAAVDGLAEALPPLLAGLNDGVGAGIGIIPPNVLASFAPGGVVGRAAGLSVDARATPGYPPYPARPVPTLPGGDVAARLRLRLLEVGASLGLVREWLPTLPAGPVGQSVPTHSGEGLAVAEGPRGDVWHWLRLDGGLIAAAFTADPSWRLWPSQEAASAGALLGDIGLIDLSFACARSGVDL